ncbi:Universal stress protein A family protein [Dioscorea alata]|uniref:Universal stress protein A family protein n=1 Tax=Dioscorea alata TaxID=55571 RepID=A0ACB7TYU4_DIOAL|nr:Universal stress protein A family protein [Dioscorea alata]
MAEPVSGTTAEPPVAEAPAAAKMKSEEEEKGMRVMVAVDESDASLYALSWTLDHFMAASSAPAWLGSLIVVHVQQPFHQYILPAGAVTVYAPAAVTDSMRKAQEQNTANVLSRAKRICVERNVTVETLVMDGEPKEMICQAVELKSVDLIVVGSRGLGRIKRAFLGSVSDYVAHHAKCPVLIVKPLKEDH